MTSMFTWAPQSLCWDEGPCYWAHTDTPQSVCPEFPEPSTGAGYRPIDGAPAECGSAPQMEEPPPLQTHASASTGSRLPPDPENNTEHLFFFKLHEFPIKSIWTFFYEQLTLFCTFYNYIRVADTCQCVFYKRFQNKTKFKTKINNCTITQNIIFKCTFYLLTPFSGNRVLLPCYS